MQHHQHEEHSEGESFFTVSRVLMGLAVGTVLAGGAIILVPHILPALGVGRADLAEEAATILHHSPTGLAGGINNLLAVIPVIGAELAKGGLFTALTTGGIGLGGVAISHFLEKNEDDTKSVKWSRIIRYGALATSALVALPTVLTALGTGIIYLSMLADSAVVSPTEVIGMVGKTLGSIGGDHQGILMGASGLAAAMPHLLLCCMSMLPGALTFKLWRDDKKENEQPKPFANRVQKPRKILSPDDPNHFITEEEKSWVDIYNQASPEMKIPMQKWFRDKGYNPDFHADGTVHLYQHSHSPANGSHR